jgi:hypothetical protein
MRPVVQALFVDLDRGSAALADTRRRPLGADCLAHVPTVFVHVSGLIAFYDAAVHSLRHTCASLLIAQSVDRERSWRRSVTRASPSQWTSTRTSCRKSSARPPTHGHRAALVRVVVNRLVGASTSACAARIVVMGCGGQAEQRGPGNDRLAGAGEHDQDEHQGGQEAAEHRDGDHQRDREPAASVLHAGACGGGSSAWWPVAVALVVVMTVAFRRRGVRPEVALRAGA